MPSINYAESYARELAQAYPNVLNFGALYATDVVALLSRLYSDLLVCH